MSENKTGFQIERIAFFSDAVFAIAITLLIIEVHPPEFPEGEISTAAIIKATVPLIPEIVAVIVSFFLISLNWRRHHQLFGILTGYNEKLITYNFFALAAIIFLPFSTAFFSKNWQHFWFHPLVLPFVIYSVNNLACAFFNYLLVRYALDPKNGLYQPSKSFDAERVKLEVLYSVLVFVVTTIVGCFNVFVAIPCFALFAFEPFFVKAFLRKNTTDKIQKATD